MAFKQKCFTFTWKLENVSYCSKKKDQVIQSPAFMVDTIKDMKWKLGLYLRGEEDERYLGFFLFKHKVRKEDDQVELKYELSFIAKDGSNLTTRRPISYNFSKCEGYGFPRFETREVVFITKRSVFLPQDTLTVQCKIWRNNIEMIEDVRCFALTHIRVEKRSFLWKVNKFSTLESEGKCTYQIKSIENDALLMTVALSLNERLFSDKVIFFKMSLQDQTIEFTTLKLFLVEASGNKLECNQEEIWFDDPSKSKEFKFFFTKNKLMEMKSSYLHNDILSLHWEWTFSRGIGSEEIEDIQYGYASYVKKYFKDQTMNNVMMTPLLYTLNDKLKSLYDENFLCDVKLKTKTKIFNAHKVILSASSSVFKAMLSSDMTEKDNNCIYIENVRDDTITQILAYIYTARTEGLTWESALDLYVAADKYAIISLKNICSSYLKDNLSSSNACEVLLLSESHVDPGLKSSVQDYIIKNVKNIIKSDGWKLLMNSNARLAAETLCLQHE